MLYLKINDSLYEASFEGKQTDSTWDNRPTKTIHLPNMTYEQVVGAIRDNAKWSIYDQQITKQQKLNENGEPVYEEQIMVDDEGNLVKDEEGNLVKTQVPVMEDADNSIEYDNSAYCLVGDITVHYNGGVSVKMGKLTELEQAYELLYGGV